MNETCIFNSQFFDDERGDCGVYLFAAARVELARLRLAAALQLRQRLRLDGGGGGERERTQQRTARAMGRSSVKLLRLEARERVHFVFHVTRRLDAKERRHAYDRRHKLLKFVAPHNIKAVRSPFSGLCLDL